MASTVKNTAAITITGTGNMSHLGAWNGNTGNDWQGAKQLSATIVLPHTFQIGEISLKVPDSTDLSDSNDDGGVNGRKAKITHVQPYSGAPGDNGANNQIGNTRFAISWGNPI